MAERLLSANQVDTQYRLRHGTAATAARAGLVKCTERRGRGRFGVVILIDARDAELEWGAKRQVPA